MPISNEQLQTIFQYIGETKNGISDIKDRLNRAAEERMNDRVKLDQTLTFIQENHTELMERVLKLEVTEQRNRGFVKGISFILTMLVAAIAWLIDLLFKVKGS